MLTNEEAEALAKGIRESAAFRVAPQRTALFNYLWARRDEYSLSIDIWEEALLEFSRAKKKDDPNYNSDQSVRERCRDLRGALLDHFRDVRDGWVIHLPPAISGKGYQLDPRQRHDPNRATFAFWQPHYQQSEVILVYAYPIFYYDINALCYLRFLDTNVPVLNRHAALQELERLHGDDLRKWYAPSPKESLRPTHIYMGIGEVAALDALSEWFSVRPFVRVTKAVSDHISSVKNVAPVLIGSSRTNRFIKAFIDSDEGQRFGYRLHESAVGHVAIENPNPEENIALGRFPMRMDAQNRLVGGTPATTSPVRDRFVIVTRMRNPGGKGQPVTMISSDTSLAIQSVALALTDDNQLTAILNAIGWPEATVPTSFEILFNVRIAPGNIDDEADVPELLASRTYA